MAGNYPAQLSRNMRAGVLSSIVTTPLMLISYRVYLHSLGSEQYGLWLALSSVIVFTQLSNLGLGQALSKQIAFERATGNSQAIASYTSTALLALLVTGSFAYGIMILLRMHIVSVFRLSPENAGMALALLPIMGALSLYALYLDTLGSVLSGFGRMDLYSYVQLLAQLISAAVSILLLVEKAGVRSLVIGNAISLLASHAMTALFLKRLTSYNLLSSRQLSWRALREMLGLGLYLSGSSVVSIFSGPLNKVLLTRYVGLSIVPAYDIAINGSMKIRSVGDSAVRALMPEVSRLVAAQQTQQIRSLNRTLTRRLMLIGGVLFASAIALCAFVLRLWLGSSAIGFPIAGLRIVLLATFLSMLGVPAYHTLLGLGRSDRLLTANVLQSGASILFLTTMAALHKYPSITAILASVAAGIILANAYLLWASNREIDTLSKKGVQIAPVVRRTSFVTTG